MYFQARKKAATYNERLWSREGAGTQCNFRFRRRQYVERNREDDVIKGRFKIAKSDDDKHLAFGWANVAIRADGEEIEDWQEDIIEPEELENAAYQYVLLYREGGEMHERGGAAVLVESVVFTEEKMQAMGIPAGTLPIGWWIGFKVTDEDVWEKVKC